MTIPKGWTNYPIHCSKHKTGQEFERPAFRDDPWNCWACLHERKRELAHVKPKPAEYREIGKRLFQLGYRY